MHGECISMGSANRQYAIMQLRAPFATTSGSHLAQHQFGHSTDKQNMKFLLARNEGRIGQCEIVKKQISYYNTRLCNLGQCELSKPTRSSWMEKITYVRSSRNGRLESENGNKNASGYGVRVSFSSLRGFAGFLDKFR